MSHPKFMPREEYIEQEYFFRVYRERLQENVPSQDILKTVHEEILSTTRLPMAVDFMRAEILHSGRISDAMVRLPHYFTPFQCYVIERAEDDVSRFEQITGLQILEREAKYRSGSASMSGSFVYQFECIVRNRLGYNDGLKAMANDPCFDKNWKSWISDLNNKLGANELSEIVYRASEHFVTRRQSRIGTLPEIEDDTVALFGEQEGRIARANIGRDPMYFFAALQRQLNYPKVPLSRKIVDEKLSPFLESRLVRLEQRLKIVELEQKGGIDLTKFYKKENDVGNGNGALDN
ncbi:MAG: hypothetical protein P8J37_17255 [Fuerstiella sp.]|nr:hypothetical protein [Fuerstiella sp.]